MSPNSVSRDDHNNFTKFGVQTSSGAQDNRDQLVSKNGKNQTIQNHTQMAQKDLKTC